VESKRTPENEELRVAVDARCLNCGHLRGMGRYVREVVRRGSAIDGVQWLLLAGRPDLPFHLPECAGVRQEIFRCRGDRIHAWDQLALPWRVARRRVDVLHCPATAAPWWQPVPTVVTVHDTLGWLPEDPDRGKYSDYILPAAYKKCAAVITISKSSCRDIVNKWPALKPKIHVIPHGVDDAFLNAAPSGLSDLLRGMGVSPPYLLYVGGELPRKRAQWAVEVLTAVADSRLSLVFCGLKPESQDRVRAAVRPDVRPRLVFTSFIPDADMVRLYQNAVALLYPTLYEGFGFPALEAQAVGTPALFSALGSLAELQGPGAIILPSHDLNAWVEVCRKLIAERAEKPRPREDARRWARQFSWQVSASRHLDVYRKAKATRRQKGLGACSTPQRPCDAAGPRQGARFSASSVGNLR
jgi:glycosyltransferase involved in cell wall biosynthesis